MASLSAAAVLQAGRLVDAPALPADRAALLVQENIPVDATWTRDMFERTLRELIDLSVKDQRDRATLHVSGASNSKPGSIDLIVWPESPAPFFTNDPLFRDPVSQMARETHSLGGDGRHRNCARGAGRKICFAGLQLGRAHQSRRRLDCALRQSPPRAFRRIFAVSQAVRVCRRIDQRSRRVSRQATSRAPLDAGGTKLGVFICYESVFPGEVRQFADQGAQVLVNISNDGWYGDSGAYAQHLNQTRMRAIENDRWLLSATNTGVTASIDPYGRTVARLPRKERAALVAPYALTSVTTFYTRHGDWFAWLCAIISAGALLTRFAFSRRRRKLLMNQELEQEYGSLNKKVRELREYL